MSDDTIYRQAAINALEKEKPTPFVNKDGSIEPFGAGQQNQWYRDGIAIMNLPPAEPVRMKGKWIAQNPLVDTEECSVCGYNIQSAEMETPFCPWCGASMSEGEEDALN